jgi:hypothetical protein
MEMAGMGAFNSSGVQQVCLPMGAVDAGKEDPQAPLAQNLQETHVAFSLQHAMRGRSFLHTPTQKILS